MKNRFELIPKDMVREIVKHLYIGPAQSAARAYPVLNDAVQHVWRDRFRRHFPNAWSEMSKKEESAITNWPAHYANIQKQIPDNLRALFYELKEGRCQKVMQARLTLLDILEEHESEEQSLFSLVDQSGNQTLLNHFYHIAKEFFKDPRFPQTFIHIERDHRGLTLLHWAILTNQSADVVRELVNNGCDIESRREDNNDTPIMTAADYRRSELVLTLMQLGASTAATRFHPYSALQIAADLDFPEIVHTLIAAGPSTNRCKILPDDTCHPLSVAGERGYLDVVKVILEDTKNPHLIDNLKERTALHIAAKHGQLDIVNYLLTLRVNVDAVDKHGMTPLHLSVKHGHHDVTLALLAHHADANKKMINYGTPIFLAAYHGRDDDFKSLIQHGADLSTAAQDNLFKMTPLYAAVLRGHNHMIQLLLDHGMDINERNIDGRTALFLAVKGNKLETAKILLAKCANPDIPNQYGVTPLHVAASMGKMEMVKLLMKYHANPNKLTNRKHWTPLAKAIGNGHTKIAKLIEAYIQSTRHERLFGWYQRHAQEKSAAISKKRFIG